MFERNTVFLSGKSGVIADLTVFSRSASPLRLNYPITSTLPLRGPFLLDDVQKKAKARTSMLWRAGAFGGVAGSLNDVCGVNRARPSVWES